jgi:PAS domain S-box-containing protein
MRIRWKTLLALGLVMLTLLTTIYLLATSTTLNNIAVSEQEDSRSNAIRLLNNLKIKLAGMNTTANDWAGWDDTYNFVKDKNMAYVESNLGDSTFTNLDIDVMTFFDESNQLVWGKLYDTASQTSASLEEHETQQLRSYDSLFINNIDKSETGLILINGSPMLVASHPILTSSNEGPIHGTLIMGRYLDESELSILSDAVGLPISGYSINATLMPSDVHTAKSQLSEIHSIFSQPLNETNMAGYALLQDVNGAPIFIVKIDAQRFDYLQAKQGTTFTGVALVALGIAIFLVAALLLETLVISRVTKLEKTVVGIRKTGDHAKRVSISGSDELSSLGQNINSMLDAIEDNTTNLEKTVKERTRQLFENQEKLRGIFSASPDAIIATDIEGKITECNNQMTQICGFDRDELIGKSAFKFFSENARQSAFETLTEAEIHNISITRFECTLTRKDQSEYPAEISTSIVRDARGASVGFVSIVRDLTEKKQLEQRLFKAERLAAIGELAGMVGHDLRNPLTAIKNADYFLKKKCSQCGQNKALQTFEVIDRAIEHANKIINDLLDYSREIHLDLSECSPKTLVDSAMTMFKPPSNIQLLDYSSTQPQMKADVEKITRVLLNVIKNACDAMPNGGTLEIRSAQNGSNAILTFSDIGGGIPKDVMPKIFMPLFTTKAQGMGFGLSICKRVIEAHGGTITINSAEGKGTTVILSVPIQPKVKREFKAEWITPQKSTLSASKNFS